MSLIKLKSSDGLIFEVDVETVQQMHTVKSSLAKLVDTKDDKEIAIENVMGEVLEKILKWIKFDRSEKDLTRKINWYNQYFQLKLEKLCEILLAADHLGVKTLVRESCHTMMTKYTFEMIKEVLDSMDQSKLIPLLENYRTQYGYEVIVTLHDKKHLRFFDTKESN